MFELAALSDLHLGDEDPVNGSVLSSEDSCEHFAEQVANISGGEIRTLVICGDLWEACIPYPRTSPSAFGLDAVTVRASERFFRTLTNRVHIRRLMIVPGNHDFALYRDLMSGFRLSLYSASCGYGLRVSGSWTFASPLSVLLGERISDIGIAYPNFMYVAGGGWPLALFTHGHLFDTQVLAPSENLLSTLGLLASAGHVFDAIPEDLDVDPGQWMARLVGLTAERVVRIWRKNLNELNAAVWGYVKRRQIHIVCGHRGIVSAPDQGSILTSGSGTGSVNSFAQLSWYLDGFMQDYSPVLTPKERQRVNYFAKGHTHAAGMGDVTSIDRTRFRVYDLGGWTKDAAGYKDNVPHKHLLAWEHFPAEPVTYALV